MADDFVRTSLAVPKDVYNDIKQKRMKLIDIFLEGYATLSAKNDLYKDLISQKQENEKMVYDIATLRQELSILKASLRVDRFVQEQQNKQ